MEAARTGAGQDRSWSVGERSLAVLGPVEVAVGGTIRPTRGRELDVLAVLALRRDVAIPMRELAEGIWLAPPATAAKTTQNLVARLRKSLGDDAIVTAGQGYRLGDGWQVDAARFQAELGSAQLAARAGDARARRDHLTLALALVRGEALGSMEPTALVARHRAAFEGQIEQARVDATAAALDAGLIDEAVQLGAQWAEAMSDREQWWLLRALALARSGERRAAINLLHRGRQDLRDRAGLRVGHAFGRLETLLLTDDPAVATMPSAMLVDSAQRIESFATAGEQLFVGRTGALAETASALDDAGRTQRPHVVLVTGGEGSGRSAFARRVGVAAMAEGWTVLRATCRAAGVKPLEPFGDLVEQLLGVSPRLRDGVPRAAFQTLGALGRPAEAGPEAESQVLELVGLLAEHAQVEHTAIVIDDADRMSPSSRAVVERLADGRGAIVVVLLSYPTDPWVDAWHDHPRVRHVPLVGLQAREVGQLVRLLTGREPEPAEVDELVRVTKGNPTLIREMVLEAPRELGDDTAPPAGAVVESVIDGFARARVRRLDESTARASVVVALASGPVEHGWALDALRVLEVPEPSTALADAVARGVLRLDEARRLEVTTDALERALVEACGVEVCDRVHDAWWKVLSANGAPILSLVPHAAATASAHPERAAAVLDEAAEVNARNGMFLEAAADLAACIAILARHHSPTDHRVLTRRTRRVDVLRYAVAPGWDDELRDVIATAESVGDHDAVVEAVGLFCALGPNTESGSVDPVLAALVERTFPLCTDDGVLARAAARASLLYSLVDYERCRYHFDVALAAARRLGDPDVLAYVLGMVYTAVTDPLELELRHQLALELVVLAERLDSPFHRFEALHLLFTTQLQRGDPLLRATMATLSGIGLLVPGTFKHWLEGYLRAALLHLDNRLDASLALAEQVRDVAPVARSRTDTSYLVQFLAIRLAQGRAGELAEPLRAIAQSQPTMLAWRAFEAWPAAVNGRWDVVEEACRLTDDGRALPRDMTWMGAVFLLARGVAAWGLPDHVERVYDLLAPCTNQMTFVGCCTFGPVDLALAELASALGQADLASDHLARARRLCAAIHAPVYDGELERAAAALGLRASG